MQTYYLLLHTLRTPTCEPYIPTYIFQQSNKDYFEDCKHLQPPQANTPTNPYCIPILELCSTCIPTNLDHIFGLMYMLWTYPAMRSRVSWIRIMIVARLCICIHESVFDVAVWVCTRSCVRYVYYCLSMRIKERVQVRVCVVVCMSLLVCPFLRAFAGPTKGAVQ